MKLNIKGFSLPLAMGLVIIISLLAYAILEYIIPFSREVKGIENSSIAYYQANSGIEDALYKVYIRNNSGALDDRTEYNDGLISSNIDYNYSTESSGTTLPPIGEGNSEYDNNWNTISQGNPIQLSIGNGFITSSSSFRVAFKVPNITGTTKYLSGATMPIINWQLSSKTNTLNASGSIIKANQVIQSDGTWATLNVDLWLEEGIELDKTSTQFDSFYSTNCSGTNSGCVLKFSVINKIELSTNNVSLPYLEWQLRTSVGEIIPLRYTLINTQGKSYGYTKSLDVRVPSQTVNEAFDFTVFQ